MNRLWHKQNWNTYQKRNREFTRIFKHLVLTKIPTQWGGGRETPPDQLCGEIHFEGIMWNVKCGTHRYYLMSASSKMKYSWLSYHT